MNTPLALLEQLLLSYDEINTLRTFARLTRGHCFNVHETAPRDEVVAIIRKCTFRVSSLVISCPHSQKAILGKEGARDFLDRAILIFARTNKQIHTQAIGYRNIIRLFDYLRQSIEGDSYHIENTPLSIGMLQGCDNLLDGVNSLFDDLSKTKFSEGNKPHFLLRFQSLKTVFSTTVEPVLFDSLQGHVSELLGI